MVVEFSMQPSTSTLKFHINIFHSTFSIAMRYMYRDAEEISNMYMYTCRHRTWQTRQLNGALMFDYRHYWSALPLRKNGMAETAMVWCLCMRGMRAEHGFAILLYLPSTNLTVYNGFVVVIVFSRFSTSMNALYTLHIHFHTLMLKSYTHTHDAILRNMLGLIERTSRCTQYLCKLLARKLFTWLPFFCSLLCVHLIYVTTFTNCFIAISVDFSVLIMRQV